MIEQLITAEPLESGYFLVRGIGPCNFAQVPWWPCDYELLESHAHPEASKDFLFAAWRFANTLYVRT